MEKEYDTIKAPTTEEMSIADDNFEIIVLSTGKMDDNSPYWAYLSILPSRYESLKNAEPPFDLEEYGTIIKAGEGEEPPEDVKKEMELEIGADHDINNQIIEMSNKLNKEREIRNKYSIT